MCKYTKVLLPTDRMKMTESSPEELKQVLFASDPPIKCTTVVANSLGCQMPPTAITPEKFLQTASVVFALPSVRKGILFFSAEPLLVLVKHVSDY